MKKGQSPVGIRLRRLIAVGFAVILSDGKPIAAQTASSNAIANTHNVLINSVLLGSDELTSGIPAVDRIEATSAYSETSQGQPLTVEQLRDWLADQRNHQPLSPRLPTGLLAAHTELNGIENNPLTRAKVELGRQLFFDKRLSHDQTISCASCHSPETSFASNDRLAIGIRQQLGVRNAPTIINRFFSTLQFHDGRADSLEEQVLGPLENKIEMGFTHDGVVERLAEVDGYQLQFEAIFGSPISIGLIAKAIAAFERTLVTGPSPWDHYSRLTAFESTYADELADRESLLEEDPELVAIYDQLLLAVASNPISSAAKRGGKLFFSQRVNCASCHAGANFTDEDFHNIGVGLEDPEDLNTDWGRSKITQDESDQGAFKTPTLRNVALTAPYMHDGSLSTLPEVIAWYVRGGHPNPQLSELIEPLEITESEQDDLVAFLESLTGRLPKVRQDSLPKQH